jgi:hypothetical protein
MRPADLTGGPEEASEKPSMLAVRGRIFDMSRLVSLRPMLKSGRGKPDVADAFGASLFLERCRGAVVVGIVLGLGFVRICAHIRFCTDQGLLIFCAVVAVVAVATAVAIAIAFRLLFLEVVVKNARSLTSPR